MPLSPDLLRRIEELAQTQGRSVDQLVQSWLEDRPLPSPQYRKLLESISDAFYALDSDWNFTYVNAEAERLLQRTAQELIGQNVWMKFPEAVETVIYTEYHRCMREQQPITLTEFYYPPLETWFDITAYPTKRGISVFFRNVNERRQQQEYLRKREQEYRALVENNPDYIARLDRNLRHVYVNPALCQLARIPFERYTKLTVHDMPFTPEALANIQKTLDAVFETQEERVLRFEANFSRGARQFEGRVVPEIGEDGVVNTVLVVARDITERLAMERRLAESEARYRAIVESQTDLVCRYTPDTVLTYVNDAYCKFFGRSREEIIGRSFLELATPTNSDEISARLAEVTSSPAPGTLEVPTLVNGALHWIYWLDHGITDSNGKVVEIQAVGRDITPVKEAELAATRAKQQLETVISNAPIGIVTLTEKGVVQSWNPAMEQIMGWKADEVIGQPAPYLARDSSAYHQFLTLAERSRQGQPVWTEVQWPHKDGIMRDLNLHVAPLKEPDGRITGIMTMMSDITTAKRAAEALRDQAEVLQKIVDNIPIMIGFVNEHGRYRLVNRHFVETLGYTQEELDALDDPLSSFYPDPVYRAEVWKFITEGGDWSNFRTQTKAGRVIDSLWTNIKLSDGTSIGIGQDVSERRRYEREREQLIQDLEARNAELRRFTYAVSHDLKSPLITISGFLGLLERDLAAGDDERVRTDMAYIKNAAEKMRELLDDLLELSRIGRMDNPRTPVDLNRLVQETISLLQGSLMEKGVVVTVEDNLPTIIGDAPRLRTIFQNLLENAIKFMGSQQYPHVTIGLMNRDGESIIVVRDNGIGIEAQHRDKIFGLFEQLDPQAGGSGIGLALVKRIVELHGGRVWVESSGLGRGSMFCLAFPQQKTGD